MGLGVGTGVGWFVGLVEGDQLGPTEGDQLGEILGRLVGLFEGAGVGLGVGWFVGAEVGRTVGSMVMNLRYTEISEWKVAYRMNYDMHDNHMQWIHQQSTQNLPSTRRPRSSRNPHRRRSHLLRSTIPKEILAMSRFFSGRDVDNATSPIPPGGHEFAFSSPNFAGITSPGCGAWCNCLGCCKE